MRLAEWLGKAETLPHTRRKEKKRRIKKMMTCEVEILYDDYCWECAQDGIEPKPIDQWWEELV